MKHLGKLTILWAAAGVLALAQTKGGGTTGNGGSTGTVTTTSSGNRGTTSTPTNNNPNLENQRAIFISGRVMLEDGTTPPDRVAIERVCGGGIYREAYTDSKGYFNFQLGANNWIFADASVDNGLMVGGARPSSTGGGGLQNSQTQVAGCELRANLPGFRSESLTLNGRSMESPDVGTIYITRLVKVDGYTTSATLALAPKDAKKAYERGVNFEKKLKPDEAQAEFLKAVDIYPKHAAAWFELGRIYENRDHVPEAREAYQKAIKADSNYVNPYERLYILAMRDGQWKETAELSDKVMRLNPYEFPGSYYANAVANTQLHNWDAAEKSAREAAKLKGPRSMPKALYVLGVVLANKGDFPASVQSLNSYLETDPLAADKERAQKLLAQIAQETQAAAKQ
jgi:tetratricopeptide (TPR) repeat protein